ncbi:hypothetical protein D3C80_1544650 [compost metagenome]
MRGAKNGCRTWTPAKPCDRRKIVVAVGKRVGVGAGVVIGLVVPARRADTKTGLVLIDHIQLGQQVDTVGDIGPGLAEIVVTVVTVRRTEHTFIGTLGAHAVVVLDGVVETHGPVFTASVQFQGIGRRKAGGEDGRYQQPTARRQEVVTLHL